jgi:hypothetical protein
VLTAWNKEQAELLRHIALAAPAKVTRLRLP